jgi:hypothetical protein
VAEKLGENEEWLWDLQINVDPEDGCLWAYGAGEQGVPAFTALGIKCLEQIIAIERAAGRAPPKGQAAEVGFPRSSPHAYGLHALETAS